MHHLTPLQGMMTPARASHALLRSLPSSSFSPSLPSPSYSASSPSTHAQHMSSSFIHIRCLSACAMNITTTISAAQRTHPIMRVHKRYAHSDKKNSIRLTMIGAPGSGKGTQSSKIERDFGLSTISTGQLLRRIAAAEGEGSELGRSVSKILKAGGLVGDGIMMDLIKREISKESNSILKGWLLDGYPRNPQQAAQLDDLLQSIEQPLTIVFHLKVPEEVLLERIQERWMHPASGRTYNMSFSPPQIPGKDDVTGEPLVRRVDDNDEAMQARLRTYHEATYPLLDYYHKKGILIPVESPTSDVGYVMIKKVLDDLATHGRLTY